MNAESLIVSALIPRVALLVHNSQNESDFISRKQIFTTWEICLVFIWMQSLCKCHLLFHESCSTNRPFCPYLSIRKWFYFTQTNLYNLIFTQNYNGLILTVLDHFSSGIKDNHARIHKYHLAVPANQIRQTNQKFHCKLANMCNMRYQRAGKDGVERPEIDFVQIKVECTQVVFNVTAVPYSDQDRPHRLLLKHVPARLWLVGDKVRTRLHTSKDRMFIAYLVATFAMVTPCRRATLSIAASNSWNVQNDISHSEEYPKVIYENKEYRIFLTWNNSQPPKRATDPLYIRSDGVISSCPEGAGLQNQSIINIRHQAALCRKLPAEVSLWEKTSSQSAVSEQRNVFLLTVLS